MLALIVAGLMTSITNSPLMLSLAQASTATGVPADRKICRDEKIPNSRFTRRYCTIVKAKVPEAPPAPPPPPVLTDFAIGMEVVDAEGAPVAVVTAVAADSVTVKTDRHEAQLPKSSMTISDGKALFGLTQAALNTSIEKTVAAMPAAQLKIGAMVKGNAGATLGTIDSVATDAVTIKLAGGQKISVPRSGIAVGADGSGTIGISAAELEAQVKAAQPKG